MPWQRNRRRGIPNVYSINRVLYWEHPDGTLSRTDPYLKLDQTKSADASSVAFGERTFAQFLTTDECQRWLVDRARVLPKASSDHHSVRCHLPSSLFKFFYWASQIAMSIAFDQPCLLWITEFGIWPSGENWSLFNRLRRSYGETAQLFEVPGHLFAGDEIDDLTSFLQLSALFGWGGYLTSEADSVNCYFSHDEFIDFFSRDERLLGQIRDAFAGDR